MIISAETDIGKVRSINQDACFVSENELSYIVVADGMGGHKAGEVASRTAIESIRSFLTSDRVNNCKDMSQCLTDCVECANREIYKMASQNDDYSGMGTTIVICYFAGDKVYIANVGDSRAYLIRHGVINQITTDHSVVQELFESGKIKRSEMRNHPNKNLITRVAGTQYSVKCDIFTIKPEKDDVIILCSDGLSNMLEDEQILDICTNTSNTDNAVKKLIDEANMAGGHDNITVAVAKF